MKTEGQCRHQFQQALYRHRKKEIEKGLSTRPCNCVHNECVELTTPNRLHRIRKCSLKNEHVDQTKKVCDEGFSGLQQAQKCPYFKCKNTPESIKREFDEKLGLVPGSQIDVNVVGREYPDLMALIWVLSPSKKEVVVPDLDDIDDEELLLMAGGDGDGL